MKNKAILFILSAFTCIVISAQPKKIPVNTGVWTFTAYAGNIVKISFKPKAYTTDENITNAVNIKPLVGSIISARANDEFAEVRGMKVNIFHAGSFYGFRILLQPNEKIFGGGERALPLNRRGYKFDLYNNPWYGYSNGADNLNFSIPFFTSSDGYGLFFDNASRGYADIGKSNNDIFETGFVSGELNVFLIFGKSYKEILSSYYKLTGTQPLPPRWAMGNFMSRFGYTGEAQTKNIAATMQKENIPFDAIIYDLFWFGDSIKGTMGNLDWENRTQWPNPKKMIADFKKENINTVLIAEPFILKGTKNYEAAKKYFAVDSANKPFNLTDFYFGSGGLLDIFRKDAGDWIWNNHYKKQIANGVNAWWTDLGEPEKHPAAMRHNMKSLGINRLMGADEVHNIYGHYWNKMLFENYTKEFPAQRLFHLSRSGFAGSQRYSIFPWSGDVSRSWSGLQAQVPLMLGMSMSGIPYTHADAGGFAGGEGNNELYVRWLQFAAFTPVFRPHGTALYEIDKNAFSFPSEPVLIDTAYRKYAKGAVDLRYALLPYNYTLAYKQAANGDPLVAPLYYQFPRDTAAANVQDEFMWGENILVAPVLEKEMSERKIYLPEGKWYNLFDTSQSDGNRWISKATTLNNIPAFVKAGSFIPIWAGLLNPVRNTSEYNVRDTYIIYYPSPQKTSGILYLDNGLTKDPSAEVIHFSGITVGNKMFLEISTNKKQLYANGFKRILNVGSIKKKKSTLLPRRINGMNVDIQALIKMDKALDASGKFQHYELIKVEFNGQPCKIELNFQED